eukprot:CAMPEP_0202866462 /NCGR_PEP_ID=MMETSP1391-20130828/7601_1 /ASSEMBLY_ACC=CAM_ASM_000867 /TAXON_ID=1034604 /ORGANISM="Chlamydomonas leiostraca, Strain SAG 11-49" /LENGTH=97 /DNA_ID=CAMNT_0049546407 /DNA_START=451 /DNA_END=744 /DNA_ORIENTATION=-
MTTSPRSSVLMSFSTSDIARSSSSLRCFFWSLSVDRGWRWYPSLSLAHLRFRCAKSSARSEGLSWLTRAPASGSWRMRMNVSNCSFSCATVALLRLR